MDILPKRLREGRCGLYARDTYMGGADDLHTTAASFLCLFLDRMKWLTSLPLIPATK